MCRANNIPTAAYEHFADAEKAKAYIRTEGAPIVVKADGLAAGKGVVVAMTEQEAFAAVDTMFGGGLAPPAPRSWSRNSVQGEEASFFALCDGEHALRSQPLQDPQGAPSTANKGPTPAARMGAYSPAPLMTDAMCARVMDEMIRPTLRALSAMGSTPTRECFSLSRLMVTKDGPRPRSNYNARPARSQSQRHRAADRCGMMSRASCGAC